MVLNSLENQYTPLNIKQIQEPAFQYHIIILGGGHGYYDRLTSISQLSKTALDRPNEGVRVHLKLSKSKLILSGSTSIPGRTTQAEML